MSAPNLEELFIESAENPTEELLGKLLSILKDSNDIEGEEISNHIDFLFESWAEDLDPVKAEFIISLAELAPADTSVFRKIINDSVKKLLPPYINKTGFIRSLGCRDCNVSLSEMVVRYRTMLQLKNGVFTYQPDSHVWGVITNIDEFSGSVAISQLNGTNSFAVPLEVVLSRVKLFHPGPETKKLAPVAKPMRIVAREYQEIAMKNVLNGLTDDELKSIASHTLTPEFIPADQFESWWRSEAGSVVAGLGRRPSEARSVHELHMLLEKLEGVEGFRFNPSDAEKLTALFSRIKLSQALNDNIMLVEAIAMLTKYMDKESLSVALEPLKTRVLFWPESADNMNLKDLEVWGKVPVKVMPEFIKACEDIFPQEYFASYATHLPLRCLNLFCEHIDDELLTQAILDSRDCSSDILLWIWKNRKSHSQHLLSMVNIKNVVNALGHNNLPAAWGSAQRELKKQLIDKKDFQNHIIDMEDDVTEIIYALQGARFFQPGEQQSLLVKLSRLSDELRSLLETGQGKKLMTGGHKQTEEQQQAELPPQPIITSVFSHRAMLKELDEIVRVHIPENRESLKVARAHGDFRENAEYDAAKERRNFLSRRRNELEADILNVQPTNFRDIELNDRIVIGCSTVFAYENGKSELFHVVGAWDGKPEQNWLSYKTRLGESVLGKKVGESFQMPDGRNAVIKEIKPLPADIVEMLADGE